MPHAEMKNEPNRENTTGTAKLLVLILAFAWGFNWIAGAIALREVTPWTLRFAGAGIGAGGGATGIAAGATGATGGATAGPG